MGVINDLGIVNIENTSQKIITVFWIKEQCKIKKSNHFGSLNWNGKYWIVQLTMYHDCIW
jgi:rod shape-determining protein MreC